jgi:HisA/HisF family protein
MKVVPVLDVKHGQVVRAVAGRRAEYRPVSSALTTSTEPLAVAATIRGHFALDTFYVADLDAIAGNPPASAMYERLAIEGFALWVDAGLRSARDADRVVKAGVAGVVAGFETLAGPDVLAQLCARLASKQVLFSLDLKDGRLFGPAERWGTAEPLEIAARAVDCGVRRLILLDLAHIGMNQGTGTEALCRNVHDAFPYVELIAGGGIRTAEDIHRLAECGVQAVLVASALHDGRLTATDIAGF